MSRSTASGWDPRRCCRAPSGCSGPFTCLNEARYGIAWGAMGAARDSYEAALKYSQERLQFGKPLAGYQLTQEKLVNMLLEIQKGTLLALHLGRLKDAGQLRPEQISLGKLNNVPRGHRDCPRGPHHPGRQRHHPGLLAAAARRQPRVGAHLRGHRRGPHPDPGPAHHRAVRLPLSRELAGAAGSSRFVIAKGTRPRQCPAHARTRPRLRAAQAEKPPSALTSWPGHPASLRGQQERDGPATSAGVPSRPPGWRRDSSSRSSPSIQPVSTGPGFSTLP